MICIRKKLLGRGCTQRLNHMSSLKILLHLSCSRRHFTTARTRMIRITEGPVLPGGNIHRIYIVAIDQWVKLSWWGWHLVPARWKKRQLLALLELLQVQYGLGVQTHTGQGLEWVKKKGMWYTAVPWNRNHSSMSKHSHLRHQQVQKCFTLRPYT